jgi:hypothetical protein
MNGLLTAIETDESASGVAQRNKELRKWRRARKKNRRAAKPVFDADDYRLDVEHVGYTIHAFGEAPIWDPRMACAADGSLSQPDGGTDRGQVIKSFFSRN